MYPLQRTNQALFRAHWLYATLCFSNERNPLKTSETHWFSFLIIVRDMKLSHLIPLVVRKVITRRYVCIAHKDMGGCVCWHHSIYSYFTLKCFTDKPPIVIEKSVWMRLPDRWRDQMLYVIESYAIGWIQLLFLQNLQPRPVFASGAARSLQ